ncbi:MAG: glycosyltransferase [Heteroscytonema crispum UTEX LB 1556]
MKPAISVIICTHNPRHNYLDKVLAALKSQTLQFEQWELLLIDNASEKLLSSEIDISWHPQSSHIREEQLGLTPARLRGIREAKAESLIFVDDDNVLDSDYLEVALRISKDYPFIGAWGGQIKPNFEVTPPDWTKPYWKWLAIREFEQDKWSNSVNQYETTPCGAGLCVRKIVAEEYAELICNDPKRLNLDRKGKLLVSGGDSDLAFTACDIGLGTGNFASLKLTHLIPASRLEEEYLIRLMEGMVYSHIILHYFRGEIPKLPSFSWRSKLYEFYRLWRKSPRDRRFYRAEQRGMSLAIQTLLKTKE